MNFGKSRARRYDEDNIKITFKDVAGADESEAGTGRSCRVPEASEEI